MDGRGQAEEIDARAEVAQDKPVLGIAAHLVVHRGEFGKEAAEAGRPGGIRGDERSEAPLLLFLAGHDPDPLHALELAPVVLHGVGQTLDPGLVLDLDVPAGLAHLVHEVDLPGVPVGDVRHADLLLIGEE